MKQYRVVWRMQESNDDGTTWEEIDSGISAPSDRGSEAFDLGAASLWEAQEDWHERSE